MLLVLTLPKYNTTLSPGFLGQQFNNLPRAALFTSFWRHWFNNSWYAPLLTSSTQYGEDSFQIWWTAAGYGELCVWSGVHHPEPPSPIQTLWDNHCAYLSIFRNCGTFRLARTICYTVQYNTIRHSTTQLNTKQYNKIHYTICFLWNLSCPGARFSKDR